LPTAYKPLILLDFSKSYNYTRTKLKLRQPLAGAALVWEQRRGGINRTAHRSAQKTFGGNVF